MPLTISATNLSELAQPGYCPRCFWVKRKSQRLPYQSFPGIFSSIDRYVKRMARHHFDSAGELPIWFPAVGDVESRETVPNYRSFAVTDPKTGVTLRGEPDEVLRLNEPTYHIVDYKTARLTNSAGECSQDTWLSSTPMPTSAAATPFRRYRASASSTSSLTPTWSPTLD